MYSSITFRALRENMEELDGLRGDHRKLYEAVINDRPEAVVELLRSMVAAANDLAHTLETMRDEAVRHRHYVNHGGGEG